MSSLPTSFWTSVALFVLPPLALSAYQRYDHQRRLSASDRRSASLRQVVADADGQPIRPPLPSIIQQLLSHCRLAYLSTVDSDAQTSHLSLMRFTYLPEEEVIILSTNRNTKKYDMLTQQKGVALLVHDFGSGESSSSSSTNNTVSAGYSITLNGTCQIEAGPNAERHRAAHLQHNPDYPQFIVGPEIAILCIHVSSARICDVNDSVQKWNVSAQHVAA
jgi:hypothetical protein